MLREYQEKPGSKDIPANHQSYYSHKTDSFSKLLKETSAHILSSDFQSPELGHEQFLCNQLIVRCFVLQAKKTDTGH